jgi:YD repeat-containing protein
VSIADGSGEFRYAFDAAARVLTSATDPSGATNTYDYDSEHRLRRARLPDGRCVSYVRDQASGRVLEERIGRCGP